MEGGIAAIVAPMLGSLVVFGAWRLYAMAGLATITAAHAKLTPVAFVIFGFFTGVTGIMGDLAKSWAKRVGHVKDCGNFFGAHGGIIDRCDGLFYAIPLVYIIYAFFIAI